MSCSFRTNFIELLIDDEDDETNVCWLSLLKNLLCAKVSRPSAKEKPIKNALLIVILKHFIT